MFLDRGCLHYIAYLDTWVNRFVEDYSYSYSTYAFISSSYQTHSFIESYVTALRFAEV